MAVNNPFTANSPDTEAYSSLFLREDELQIGLVTIFEAAARLKTIGENSRGETNLNWAEIKAIISVGAKPDSVMNLAQRLGVTKQALTKTLRALEANGFISRKNDKRDKRRQIICLTAKGSTIERRISDKMRSHLARAYRSAGKDAVFGADQVLWSLLTLKDTP